MRELQKWRFAGIVTIILLGMLLHFLYPWTGGSKIIGLFVPVNESVWEHLKLGYWSLVLFSFVERLQLKSSPNNYYLAKLLGVLVLEATILTIYYVYTFIAGKNIFWLDILSYVLGVISCQYLAHLIYLSKSYSLSLNRIGLAAFVSIGIMFGIMTFHPPHLSIFMDQKSKTYGIYQEK